MNAPAPSEKYLNEKVSIEVMSNFNVYGEKCPRVHKEITTALHNSSFRGTACSPPYECRIGEEVLTPLGTWAGPFLVHTAQLFFNIGISHDRRRDGIFNAIEASQ
jgi:hypothetical protein